MTCALASLSTPPAQAQAPQPVSLAVDPAGQTRILWDNPDTSTALWQINNDTARSVVPGSLATYGPYGNTFRAKSVAVGPNSAPRILWTMSDGTAVLWNGLYGQPGFTQAAYGPFAGWTALGVSVGADNKARLLWTCTTGQMSVWTETAASGVFTHDDEGPYAGWAVKSLAVGPDNLAHILWNKTDGTISLWNGTPAANPSTWTNGLYGPYSGWTGAAVAVGGNNVAYILGSKPDGSAQLWTVGSLTSLTGYVYGPYSGWTPRAIGVYPTPGQSASSYAVQMLWAQAGGVTSLWTVAANGAYSQAVYPSPAGLSLSATSVLAGASVTGTVSLNVPALAGGCDVALTSSDPAVFVPATVTVPAGQTSAPFSLSWGSAPSSQTVTISAAANGVTQNASLTVQPLNAPTLSASPGNGRVGLTWNTIGPVTGYTVSRSRSANGAFSPLVSSGSIKGIGYTDSAGLSNGTTYYYRVNAVNGSVIGPVSAVVSAKPLIMPDFTLSVNPSSVNVTRGGQVTATVSLNSLAGFADSVRLSILPYFSPGVNYSYSPPTMSSTSVLTISADVGAPTGPVTLTLLGIDAGNSALRRTLLLPLTVNLPPPPTVAQAASANPATVTGKTTALSALGADASGESNLTYSWATTGAPPAPVTFSYNNSNAAKNTVATFTTAGNYDFQVTITNGFGLSVTSPVSVTVSQTVTTVSVSPTTANVIARQSTPFTATALDQFGTAIALPPNFTWAVINAAGSIATNGPSNSNGQFTAANSASGTYTITVTSGGVSGTATVNIASSDLFLTAAATGSNKITLYWNGIMGASGYNIYRGAVSGGPYSIVASNIITTDPGPGMSGNFMYSDQVGLVSDSEYFYVVKVIQSGAETIQSNEASTIPQTGAVPWDTGDPIQILNAQTTQLNAVLPPDLDSDTGEYVTPDVGLLTAQGPNGVIYEGADTDGNPAISYASPGYYDVANHQVVFSDGATGPFLSEDDSVNLPAKANLPDSLLIPSFITPLALSQTLNFQFPPSSGIQREILSQPGYVGLSTTELIFPSPGTSPGSVHLSPSGAAGKMDSAVIYTGGRLVNPVTGQPIRGTALDMGIYLMTSNPSIDPGWMPFVFHQHAGQGITTINRPHSSGGSIGSQRALLYGDASNPLQMSFVTGGQNRRYLQGQAALHFKGFYKLVTRGVNRVITTPGATMKYGSLTFTSTEPNWTYSNGPRMEIKRVNSIAQNIATGISQLQNNSFIYDCAWGGDQSNGEEGKLFQYQIGYTDWDQSAQVTLYAGGYPQSPATPGSTNFVFFQANAPYHSENHINLSTTKDITLPGR